MLPVTRGALEARRRSIVYSVVTVFVSLSLYATGDVGLIYLGSAAVLGGALVILSIQQLHKATVAAAWTLFKYSTTYLALLFGAMVIDRLLPL
jgi:protoheme IX farnesyltransferase